MFTVRVFSAKLVVQRNKQNKKKKNKNHTLLKQNKKKTQLS